MSRPQTAQYSKEIYKRFRKWGGVPIGVTQNVSDLLDSPVAQSIFYSSDSFVLLGQSSKLKVAKEKAASQVKKVRNKEQVRL